jgi:regulator of protease activity HflC (stomatin/prohibitin superfamily)
MALVAASGCGRSQPVLEQDQVHKTELADVRLGDGVPLKLALAIRWRIEEPKTFAREFPEPAKYATLVFDSKAREAAGSVANAYESVAAVFREEREKFQQDVKGALARKLAEPGVTIKDVILAEVLFPKHFTDALEVTATKEQELERIRQQSAIEQENAKAAQLKATAEGQIEIEKAKVTGKVAEINADAEKLRRRSSVAKAETEAQVLKRKARAEVERQRMLNAQDAEQRRKLNQIELEKVARLKELDVEKQKQLDDLALIRDRETAKIYAANPAYASFLVNKELASKVQLAVLPLGTESGVLGNLINGAMGPGKK